MLNHYNGVIEITPTKKVGRKEIIQPPLKEDNWIIREKMIVYHGSTVEIQKPRILTNEIGRDFGFAFYTTDIKEQAIRWAKRKAMIENRKGKKQCVPIINEYEWVKDADTKIRTKYFQGASMEWLEMVIKCRGDISYQHNYDIVIGNIADDNVGETVSFVMQGIMRKEDALERLKFEMINNQIAFCSEASLGYLCYRTSFTE